MSIDCERVKRLLNTKNLGQNIFSYEVLESTNITARKLALSGCPDGSTVVCDYQTAGRGRRGRTFTARPFENILMSLILKRDISPELSPRYTIGAAVGVYRAVLELGIRDVKIKWPNDIVVNGQKLAGILLDSALLDGRLAYVIVGIGLNVNVERFDDDIADIAISLSELSGRTFERESVLAKMLNCMEEPLELCETDEGFARLLEEYRGASAVLGRNVRIVGADGESTGVVVGFDGIGRIEVEIEDGQVEVFSSGDVSLRVQRTE